MEGFKVREEDNMSKPRGKYELEKVVKVYGKNKRGTGT